MKYRQILSDTALTAGTLAGAVDAAYRYKENKEHRREKNFYLLDQKHVGGSKAYLFKHVEGMYILTFPGTVMSKGADILVDFGFIIQKMFKDKSSDIVLKRMHEALKAAGELISKYGLNSENTVVTGHSLGGSEARYVSGQTGIHAVVFSAPHHPVMNGIKPSDIFEISVNFDPVDDVGDDNTNKKLDAESVNPLINHGIKETERLLRKNFNVSVHDLVHVPEQQGGPTSSQPAMS